MIDLEFLKKYPFATEIIKDWFHQKMIESFRDPEIAEEFKEFVLEQGMELDKLAFLINSNPRMLFDVFDKNEIYLNISRIENIFMWSLAPNQFLDPRIFNSRKEAEHAAIEKAFDILENQLSPKEENN